MAQISSSLFFGNYISFEIAFQRNCDYAVSSLFTSLVFLLFVPLIVMSDKGNKNKNTMNHHCTYYMFITE